MKDEDKKLILEWCGFISRFIYGMGEAEKWFYPDGSGGTADIRLDLNFYFKYAVPKITSTDAYTVMVHMNLGYAHAIIMAHYAEMKSYASWDKDPAEAFGQALLKLIKAGIKQ